MLLIFPTSKCEQCLDVYDGHGENRLPATIPCGHVFSYSSAQDAMDKMTQILDTPLASPKAKQFLNAIEGLMDVEESPATFQRVGKSLTAWLHGQPSDQFREYRVLAKLLAGMQNQKQENNGGYRELDDEVKRGFDEAKRELGAGNAELNKAKREPDEVKLGLDEIKRELDEVKRELDKAKREPGKGNTELNKAKRELDDVKRELDDVKRELDKAKRELDDAKLELDKAKWELGEGNTELYAKLNKAERDLDKVKWELDAARMGLDTARIDLEMELEAARAELDEARTELNKATQELDKAKREPEVLTSRAEQFENELLGIIKPQNDLVSLRAKEGIPLLLETHRKLLALIKLRRGESTAPQHQYGSSLGATHAETPSAPPSYHPSKFYLTAIFHVDTRQSQVAFSTGRRIAYGNFLYDATSGDKTKLHDMPKDCGITSVALSRDGTKVASGDNKGCLRVWSAQTRGLLQSNAQLELKNDYSECIAFSNDDTDLVSGSSKSGLLIWRQGGTSPASFPKATDLSGVKTIAFTPDGDRLISGGGQDYWIRIWNAKEWKLIHRVHPDASILSVVVLTDGKQFASCDEKGNVRLWSTEKGADVGALSKGGEAGSIAFSPDSQWIASTAPAKSKSDTIQIRNALTGAPFEPEVVGIPGPILSIAFSPDGNQIAACNSGTMGIWTYC